MEEETELEAIPSPQRTATSSDNVEDTTELTTEAPPNYNDVVSGRAPSVRISGVNPIPQNITIHSTFNSSSNFNSTSNHLPTVPENQNSPQQSSQSNRRGMRRTKSANRPARNSPRSSRSRPSSCANPISPWTSSTNQQMSVSDQRFSQFIEDHQPGVGIAGGTMSHPDQQSTQGQNKCAKYFLVMSLGVCPVWLGLCIAFAAIAGVFSSCPAALFVGIETAVFVAIGIISCTMSILVCLCMRLGSQLSLRIGFITWWLVWVILIAMLGVLIYLGWNEILEISIMNKHGLLCDDIIRYTTLVGLAVGVAFGAVLIVLVVIFCLIGVAVTCCK